MITLLTILALLAILYYIMLNCIGIYYTIFNPKLMKETVAKQDPNSNYTRAIVYSVLQTIGLIYAFYYIITTQWF